MELTIDRERGVPLREQIAEAVRKRIRSGEWPAGERLPSSRELATRLGVNRATVVLSFRDLQDEGWIESGVGRGTFVSGNVDAAPRNGAAARNGEDRRLPWERLVGARARHHEQCPMDAPKEDLIPLGRAVSNPELFPFEEVRAALDAALAKYGEALLDYAPPAGFEPLRELLRERFERRGFDMERNEVIVLGGSQQGLDLIARLLLRDGGTVATSRPTFYGVLQIFREHRVACTGIPMDAEGLIAAELEAAVRARRPRLIYNIPYCHNPTGLCTTDARLDRTLSIARRHQVPVLEDDWLGELRGPDEPVPLKARDVGGHVLYLGTISKALFPGMRLGWLVVPNEIFDALLDLKVSSDLATNLPGQAVLAELLETGAFDRHLELVAQAFDRRRRIVSEAIEEHLPAEVRPLGPHKGMVTWLQLPARVHVPRLVEAARREGVEVAAGNAFDPDGWGLAGLRLGYIRPREQDLAPAIERLGRCIREALKQAQGAPQAPLL